MTGHKWCGRPGSRPVPIRAPGGYRARPLLRCLPAAPLDWAAGGTQNPQARCGAPHISSCGPSRWYARPAQSPPMSRAAPLTTATHWSANYPTQLGGYKLTRMCAAAAPTHRPPVARRPTPARPHARTPRSRSTRADRSPPAGDRAVEASATDDVLATKRARQVHSHPGEACQASLLVSLHLIAHLCCRLSIVTSTART